MRTPMADIPNDVRFGVQKLMDATRHLQDCRHKTLQAEIAESEAREQLNTALLKALDDPSTRPQTSSPSETDA